MNVLLIGSGAREHAIAMSLESSSLLDRLYVAPGNGGTHLHNVDLDVGDHVALIDFVSQNEVELVVIGPEAPMAEGLADDLNAVGVKVFAPSRAAAELEWSKTFTREFTTKLGIAGPRFASFDDANEALSYLDEAAFEVVVKADGLAAGKGVLIPDSVAEAKEFVSRLFDSGSSRVVIEERLVGEEVSLLGFCDGQTVSVMPAAQDHKRAFDGDLGPNTGGMGAFAPAPRVSSSEAESLCRQFLEPAVDGMAAAGIPFVGVLYAGLMLTPDGPRLLEYNCRFGDPESQVILPLLESDLLEIMLACVEGRLSGHSIVWKDAVAGTVVLASEGYPGSYETGFVIKGLDNLDQAVAYHAGTARSAGEIRTAGGRVLSITAVAQDLSQAMAEVYIAVERVAFDAMFYRTDIGGNSLDAYAAVGVDIAAGAAAVDGIADAVRSTHDERVLRGIGAFGGAISAKQLKVMNSPVLIASTDGVGTKTLIAAQTGDWHGIGQDIVNHGVNDVLVQGAKPLFFLDGIAAAKMDADIVSQIVAGMAEACRENSCVLLGGETAEMPGVLMDGAWDVTGTLVGTIEESSLLPKDNIAVGDVLIGIASNGLHTNGYSLARQVLTEQGMSAIVPGSGVNLAEALLVPHRSYLDPLASVLDADLVKALIHVTGGGLVGNTPRALSEGLSANIDVSSWPTPPLFEFLVEQSGLDTLQAHRIFNMGIGMVLVVADDQVLAAQQMIDEPSWVIGEIVEGEQGVMLQ